MPQEGILKAITSNPPLLKVQPLMNFNKLIAQMRPKKIFLSLSFAKFLYKQF